MRADLLPGLLRISSILPLPLLHLAGSLLGWLAYQLPNNSKRRVTFTNLRLCFPDKTEAEYRRLARRSLIETGKLVTESPLLWFGNRQRVMRLVKQVSGEHLLQQARAQQRPVLIAAPHIGNWELVGLYCSYHYPMTSMYRPQRHPGLDAAIRNGRERYGAHLVPSDTSGIRQMLKSLHKHELVGILPDQSPSKGTGVFAPFFGVSAYSPVLLPRLAQKTGALTIFCYAERLSAGRGFHLHFLPAPEGVGDAGIDEAVAHVNEGVAACVARLPEQYWWSYKRFRQRPAGEPPVY